MILFVFTYKLIIYPKASIHHQHRWFQNPIIETTEVQCIRQYVEISEISSLIFVSIHRVFQINEHRRERNAELGKI